MNTLSPLPHDPAVTAVSAVVPPAPHEAPVLPQASAADKGEPGVEELHRAVDKLNEHFSKVPADLRFSVDKDLGRIVVTVVDARDGSILRQMPSVEALRIARMIDGNQSHLIEALA